MALKGKQLFLKKKFKITFFKIDNISLDPDSNGDKILYPDPKNSMYLDPQPWF